MIINPEEKVCVIERRHFVEDPIRFFTGQVLATSENALRIIGYVWIAAIMKGVTRKPDLTERIIYQRIWCVKIGRNYLSPGN